MGHIDRKMNDIVTSAVSALGYELVGCELQAGRSSSILRVYVDSADGVGSDDCAKISRQISAVLDVEDPIAGRYHLEVSSPGLERPLYTEGHYQRFVGRKLTFRLRVPREGQRRFEGVIVAAEGGQVTLQVNDAPWQLNISEIDKANLIFEK